MTLDACLRLHGQLCAEEMLPFQETLEQFFRKNFAPELRVLGVDGILESEYAHSISPSSVSTSGVSPVSPPSIFDGQPSAPAFLLPPIQLGRSAPPRADSIRSPRLSIQESIPDAGPSTPRPNPLKRQLQHLARHGFSGGVTSGPVSPVSETIRSPDSPASGSFINVMAPPGLSATPSISGKSSMKSRLSRLGSMRLGR
jgi:dedicator of cytokinesis protein 3